MRPSAPLILALLLVVPLVGAEPPDTSAWAVEFSTPAQAHGQVSANGLSTAFIVFSPEDSGAFAWSLEDGKIQHHQAVKFISGGIRPVSNSTTSTEAVHQQSGSATFQGTWASLYVEAEEIEVAFEGRTDLVSADEGRWMSSAFPHADGPMGTWRRDSQSVLSKGTQVLGEDPTGRLILRASQVLRAEWHNATVTCETTESCPTTASYPLAPGLGVGDTQAYVLEYGEIIAGRASLEGSAMGVAWVAFGMAPSLDADGSVRLPLARLQAPCVRGCIDPDGGTLQLEGRIHLTDVQPSPDDDRRLRADLAGNVQAGRLDEQTLDPKLLGLAAAAVAGTGLLAGAIILLKFFLFGGWKRRGATHPRRQQLLELIVKEPGINFHGIRRDTGLGSGVLHHHLDQLNRQGAIIARRDGNRVRYFENHGTHDAHWPLLAALRDESVRRLFDWMTIQGTVSRQATLGQAAEWGWKSSITRYRISKLLGAGLLSSSRNGRALEYRVQAPNGLATLARSANESVKA